MNFVGKGENLGGERFLVENLGEESFSKEKWKTFKENI